MEYEVIKNITEEQLDRIEKERHQSFGKKNVRLIKANGVEIGFGVAFFICGRLTIEYYLFKEFQNCGYGSQFVNVLTDSISEEYASSSTVYLLIYCANIPSVKVAERSGYTLNNDDWEFKDIIHDEMPNHYVYSKENPYYERHIKAKVNKTPHYF